MKYQTVFDVVGPIMVGPSSSHTAGAIKIGKIAREIFGRKPKNAVVSFYGSFAKTYQGHGTDLAIIGGILDFDTDDSRILNSKKIAEKEGVNIQFIISDEKTVHPNTARILLEDEIGKLELVGISVGGGLVDITEINGFIVKVSGNSPIMLVFHEDKFGLVASVANVLGKNKINIGHMEVARKEKGSVALMLIETDNPITDDVIKELNEIKSVNKVILLKTN
ncbi:MAG: L-serine ammonia-lyase, iron-sulfur-dependent subunit beta [Vulcanibacillus sp.]